jgi:NTP pyrophosphatase (non-canonical NTP hydrolase)
MEKRSLTTLAAELRTFAAERDWDQFHSPKNLAIALSVEASELLEEFQWLTEEQSRHPEPERLKRIKEEIGDVLIYLTRLSDRLNVDPLDSAFEKLEMNREKYPVDRVKGKSNKYTEY